MPRSAPEYPLHPGFLLERVVSSLCPSCALGTSQVPSLRSGPARQIDKAASAWSLRAPGPHVKTVWPAPWAEPPK